MSNEETPPGLAVDAAYLDKIAARLEEAHEREEGQGWRVIEWSAARADYAFGATSVVDVGDGWAIAVKIRSTPSYAPAVEELRIFPIRNLPIDPFGQLPDDAAGRTRMDRAFWLEPDEPEGFLWEHASPRVPIPGQGVGTGLLRRIPLAEIVSGLARGFVDNVESTGRAPDESDWSAFSDVMAAPGSRGSDRGDLFYARAAAIFLELLRSGEKSPVKLMGSRPGCNESAVKGWLAQAKRRDLYIARGRGRPGGVLTEKARKLLADANHEELGPEGREV